MGSVTWSEGTLSEGESTGRTRLPSVHGCGLLLFFFLCLFVPSVTLSCFPSAEDKVTMCTPKRGRFVFSLLSFFLPR